jgi:hypothetical protein
VVRAVVATVPTVIVSLVVVMVAVVVVLARVLTLMVAGRVVGAVRGKGGSGAADRHHDRYGEGRCASFQHLLPPWTSCSPIAPPALIRMSPGIRRETVEGSAPIRT